ILLLPLHPLLLSPPSFLSSTYPSTTHIYTLSLHDALPISPMSCAVPLEVAFKLVSISNADCFSNSTGVPYNPMDNDWNISDWNRSEEHTSELQSRFDLVCRLLLEKKK